MKRFFFLITFLSTFSYAQQSAYILCEGNYGSLNASLWTIGPDMAAAVGPVHWNIADNPLGDVGQSLKVIDNKIYIVMNNSSTIEIADISDGFNYITSIDLPGAGPRDIEIIDDIAYVSCWYLSGILRIDIQNYSIIDTIALNCLPEDLLYYHDKLYTAITMNPDWTSSNQVFEIDISDEKPMIVDTFLVVKGPEELLGIDDEIYVSSTYYDDAWNTYAGNSCIDLNFGTVTTKDFGVTFQFGRDITLLNSKVYRIYNNGICALTDSLTMDTTKQIGNYGSIYSMASIDNYIYLGLSDYTAPDNVVIIDTTGAEISNFQVGAIPGAFAFSKNNGTSDIAKSRSKHPQDFLLNQNYPNPFNATTVISYSLQNSGHVTFSIYNALGQNIIDLVNAKQNSGNYTISWNGANSCGIPVANGIYYGVISNDRQQSIIKMLYLK